SDRLTPTSHNEERRPTWTRQRSHGSTRSVPHARRWTRRRRRSFPPSRTFPWTTMPTARSVAVWLRTVASTQRSRTRSCVRASRSTSARGLPSLSWTRRCCRPSSITAPSAPRRCALRRSRLRSPRTEEDNEQPTGPVGVHGEAVYAEQARTARAVRTRRWWQVVPGGYHLGGGGDGTRPHHRHRGVHGRYV